MADLNSILGDQAESGEDTQVDAQEQQQFDGQEATGEKTTAPPAEEEHQEQEDGDRRIKGFQAAAVAERQKRQQAEQRAQQFEQELAQLRQQHQPAEKKPQTQGQVQEPAREDFASDKEYFQAIARAEWQQLNEASRAEQRQRQEQDHAQKEQQAEQQAVNDIVKKGQVKYRDFDAVINDGLGPFLTREFAQVLMVSGRAEEIAYALGKDPLEAQRISSLPPARMLHAIGLMESKLSDEPQGSRAGPSTLTQARNAQGQFNKAYSGPTPLDDIPQRKT